MMGQKLFRLVQEVSTPDVSLQLRSSVWDEPDELEVTMVTYTLTTMVSGVHACVKPAGRQWARNSFEDLGRIYYLPKGAPLIVRPKNVGVNQHMACVFSSDFVEKTGLMTAMCDDPIGGRNIDSQSLNAIFNMMARELHNPGFASNLLIDGLALSLGVELSRTLMSRSSYLRFKGGLADWQLRRVRERIGETDAIPAMSELASLCGISERQLMRAFKQSTGDTIYRYAEAVRLEKAKHLLQSDMPVKRVAARLGFQNVSNFSAAFRRKMLLSPSEFQRLSRATSK